MSFFESQERFLWGPSYRGHRSVSFTIAQHQIHSPQELLKFLTWCTGRSSPGEQESHLLLCLSDGELSEQDSPYTVSKILPSQLFSGPCSELGGVSLT